MKNLISLLASTMIVLALTVIQSLAQSIYEPYTFTTLAGHANSAGTEDGTGSAARFNQPAGVAVDNLGNVYVADTGNNTIRKVTLTGAVTTLAGLMGNIGSADGTGSVAQFSAPNGVAVDSAGNVYVADTGNSTIRKVTPAGVVTTLAGLAGSIGSADGTGNAARFNYPRSAAVDSAGNVYVADVYNATIRKVTPAGVVTTLAGLAGSIASADGTGSAARFNQPWGVAVDDASNVYVADAWNHTIRKVTPAGEVTTLAGLANKSGDFDGNADGAGGAGRFGRPLGVAVDNMGNVYVVEIEKLTIRKVSPAGAVTTLAGGTPGSADGTGSAARFYYPRGVAADNAGNIYVADTQNHTIRKGFPTVQFASLAYNVIEDAGFAYIPVILGRSYTNLVTVDYATSDGSATAGLDYTATNGTLTFLPGQTTATFTVPILNDNLVENSETLNLTLSHSTGGPPFGDPINAVLTISDNDLVILGSPSDVSENDGKVTMSVRRIGDVTAPTTVHVFSSDASARAGLDYLAQEGTFTFPAGSTNETFTFTIPLLENSRVDGDRAFLVNLTNAAGFFSQFHVTIHDNEIPALLDLTFNPGVVMSVDSLSSVDALAVQPDGKILIGGRFDTVESVGRTNIARLNADGSLDVNFVANMGEGSPYESQVRVMALQTNGDVLVAGNFTSVNGVTRNGLARLNPDGSLDPNFNPVAGVAVRNLATDPFGNIAQAVIHALAIQPDGKIILGGTFDTVNGARHTNLARLQADGTLDSSFVAETELVNDYGVSTVYSLALQPTGTILVGGSFTTVNGESRASIARLNADGSLDDNFFAVQNGDNPGAIKSIIVQTDGAILVAGSLGPNGLARLSQDGRLDPSFDPVGAFTWPSDSANYPVSRRIDAVAVGGDGAMIIAASFCVWTSCNSEVKRFNPDGSPAESFPLLGGHSLVKTMAVQRDGNLLIGGDGYLYGDAHSFVRAGLARLYGNPSLSRVQFASNQDPNTSLSSADIIVSENAGVATITVERLGDSSNMLTVDFATSDGTATAGLNYVATNGTLAFAPLEITKTITIPILNDHLIHNDLEFQLALSHPTGGGALGVNALTITIHQALTISNSGLGFGFNGDRFVFNLTGPAGRTVIVEASPDLVTWLPLWRNSFGWSNTFVNALSFSEARSGASSNRFYRAYLP